MMKMTSAKEFVWNEIIESGMDIETFKECYQAISRTIPQDWQAIPRNLITLFSEMVTTFESNSLKSRYQIEDREFDTFSLYLLKNGYAISKDAKAWKHIQEIRADIHDSKNRLKLLAERLSKGIVQPVVDAYETEKKKLNHLYNMYSDAITLDCVTFPDGRTLKVSNDWYILD